MEDMTRRQEECCSGKMSAGMLYPLRIGTLPIFCALVISLPLCCMPVRQVAAMPVVKYEGSLAHSFMKASQRLFRNKPTSRINQVNRQARPGTPHSHQGRPSQMPF